MFFITVNIKSHMATVYILYSSKLDKFYIGSCQDFESRLEKHLNKEFNDAFSAKADDWEVFFLIDNLEYKQAREVESHIKKMKSKKYILDLKKYNELLTKLVERFKIK
jgi:putative endonuclease